MGLEKQTITPDGGHMRRKPVEMDERSNKLVPYAYH